jgi:hypothetical protein
LQLVQHASCGDATGASFLGSLFLSLVPNVPDLFQMNKKKNGSNKQSQEITRTKKRRGIICARSKPKIRAMELKI